MEPFNIKQLQLTIYLRLGQLKREELATLSYQNIIDTLFDSVWKDKYPTSLSDAVNDIMTLSADRIVAYLSRQAIVDSKNHTIDEYADLLKGEL
ncbi:MAG: post-transcriptional regulator [Erysipelotrichaceae bacterium]|nr:post-transcriptional regulator [Erysipelotrichaceae bacterium]